MTSLAVSVFFSLNLLEILCIRICVWPHQASGEGASHHQGQLPSYSKRKVFLHTHMLTVENPVLNYVLFTTTTQPGTLNEKKRSGKAY